MKNLLDNSTIEDIEDIQRILNETLNTIRDNNQSLACVLDTAHARALPVFILAFCDELIKYTPALTPMLIDAHKEVVSVLLKDDSGEQLCLPL